MSARETLELACDRRSQTAPQGAA